MSATTTGTGWTMEQAKLAVKYAKDPWGKGWELLSAPIREALVAKEVLNIVMAQVGVGVKIDPRDVESLNYMAMQVIGKW